MGMADCVTDSLDMLMITGNLIIKVLDDLNHMLYITHLTISSTPVGQIFYRR